MELKDVKVILNRVKVNYPTFTNDAYTQSEWYKELKDYSLDDVMNKLEQHFRSETYGNQIPKVYFLTKYLTKEKDKTKNDINNIKVRCSICGDSVYLTEYDNHYDRCSSVEYLNLQSQRLFDKEIDKEKYKNMDNDDFNKIYDNVLMRVSKISTDNDELTRIKNYFESV